MYLNVYDPATNTFEDRGLIVPGLSGETRPIVTGPDGRLYGSGSYPDGRIGLYVYDPTQQKVVRDYGELGPKHANGAWNRYDMAADDQYAYMVSGMVPWYLISVNLETGEDKVLFESPAEQRIDIAQRFPGGFATVPGQDGGPPKQYWLWHGEAMPKTDDTPPWPKTESPWDRAGAKPQIYRGQIDPDDEGHATIWFRSAEDAANAPARPAADATPSIAGVEGDPAERRAVLPPPDHAPGGVARRPALR